MAYSIDFRKKVLSVKEQKNLTFSEVSERFCVGMATVVRWSNHLEPKKSKRRPTLKMDWDALLKDVEEHPDSYQYERAERFGVSRQGIAYALKRLNLSRKKKPLNTQKPMKRHNGSFKLK